MQYLVGREKVREYAHAIGETAPICHDVEAALTEKSERAGLGHFTFTTRSVNQRGELVCEGTWLNIVR